MNIIQEWSYSVIYLGLAVFCYVQIPQKAGKLISLSFIIHFIGSLMWRIFTFAYDSFGLEIREVNYQVLGLLSFFLNIIGSAIFVYGIVALTQKSTLANQSDQSSKIGSTKTYLICLYLGLFILLVGSILLTAGYRYTNTGIAVLALGLVLLLTANILLLILLYRLWRFTIENSRLNGLEPSIDSPGKAVGFLFIPIFALYWVFKVFAQLPKDLNALAETKKTPIALPEKIGLFIAILTVGGVIPYLGIATSLITGFILMPVFVSQCINACDQIDNCIGTEEIGAVDYTTGIK